MFVNRQKELDTLHREYKKESASFSVIFGRRRMGKTALISAYIKNKPTIYYYATEITRHQHIEQLASQILRFINKPHLKDIKFSDMEQLLIFFAEEIRHTQEKLIFAIDEYQEIVKVIPEFSSILQKVWDIHLKSMKIHMILCGSALSMMHSETLAYDAPLYGRRTSNIHLKSMKFQNIKDFLPLIHPQDAIKVYASFGTVPKYLEMYDETLDFLTNVKLNILDKNAYLYQEVKYLLKEEKGDGPTYFSILQTISMGEKKIGNIAKRLQIPTNHLTRYLLKLIDLDIIEKEVPITEKNPSKSKLGRYRIVDKFINFWFFYVYKNLSFLEIDQFKYVIKEIENTFNQQFVSFAFEDFVKELLIDHPEHYLDFIPQKIGRWWNKNDEIDLIAIGEQNIALIECKWQNQPVDIHTYQKIVKKSQWINTKLPVSYILFSKAGFHDSLEKIPNLKIYSYIDLLN